MVAILEKIVFNNFAVGGKCNLFHHGTVQDCLQNSNFEFHSGKLYGIIGEFGDGGAALSCGITGNTDFFKGEVFIDDKEVSIEHVIKSSWYVGLDLNKTKRLFRGKQTIREQIEYGVRNIVQDFDSSTIQNIFSISNERINRSIEFVGNERWKASVAIGYSNGKKVFCYPWMNSKDIERFKEQLSKAVGFLLNLGCIVIVPTTKEENIRKIHSEYNLYFL